MTHGHILNNASTWCIWTLIIHVIFPPSLLANINSCDGHVYHLPPISCDIVAQQHCRHIHASIFMLRYLVESHFIVSHKYICATFCILDHPSMSPSSTPWIIVASTKVDYKFPPFICYVEGIPNMQHLCKYIYIYIFLSPIQKIPKPLCLRSSLSLTSSYWLSLSSPTVATHPSSSSSSHSLSIQLPYANAQCPRSWNLPQASGRCDVGHSTSCSFMNMSCYRDWSCGVLYHHLIQFPFHL